nr:hypothetical protein [Vibrio alginolyticus]
MVYVYTQQKGGIIIKLEPIGLKEQSKAASVRRITSPNT